MIPTSLPRVSFVVFFNKITLFVAAWSRIPCPPWPSLPKARDAHTCFAPIARNLAIWLTSVSNLVAKWLVVLLKMPALPNVLLLVRLPVLTHLQLSHRFPLPLQLRLLRLTLGRLLYKLCQLGLPPTLSSSAVSLITQTLLPLLLALPSLRVPTLRPSA
jgi:hypothetical protein